MGNNLVKYGYNILLMPDLDVDPPYSPLLGERSFVGVRGALSLPGGVLTG